jgi:large subunit ribosomal protein L24
MNTKLKRDDVVQIITGKDKGKTGKILEINYDKGRVIVEGCNMVKKTIRKRSEQEPGRIIDTEAPLHISNVMYLDKGKPSRLGYKIEKNKKVRVAKKSGDKI